MTPAIDWRKFASKLRLLPKEMLSSELDGISDNSSDSELMRAVIARVPQMKDAFDVSDIDSDVSKWEQLRADQASQPALDSAATWARRKSQLADETFSYPLNAALRATGIYGEEDTAGELASKLAGDGVGGAAANIAMRIATDPTNFIGGGAVGVAAKASPVARAVSKVTTPAVEAIAKVAPGAVKFIPSVPTAVGGGFIGWQGSEVYKIGREKGFDSPEFKAALAAGVTGVVGGIAAGSVLGGVESLHGAPVAPKPGVTPPRAPLAPEATRLDSAGLAAATKNLPAARPTDIAALKQAEAFVQSRPAAPAPVAPAPVAPKPADVQTLAKVLEAVQQHVDPEGVAPLRVSPEDAAKAALAEDGVGLDELPPPKYTGLKAEAAFDDDTRGVIDADANRIVETLKGIPLRAETARPESIASRIGPFYKWDLAMMLGHGPEDIKKWPAELRANMKPGGPNAPMPLGPVKDPKKHPRRTDPMVEMAGGLDVRAEDLVKEGWINHPEDLPAALAAGQLHPDPNHEANQVGRNLAPEAEDAMAALQAVAEKTGMLPRNVMAALKAKGETAAKVRVRRALMELDPFQGHEQLYAYQNRAPQDQAPAKETQPHNGVKTGWKLHVNAETEAQQASVAAIAGRHGAAMKVGNNSGQSGKAVTIYAGSRVDAEKLATDLHSLGLPEHVAGSDAMVDDVSFGRGIMGRFDANDPEFHQYGARGIPATAVDAQNSLYGGPEMSSDEVLGRADEILKKRYGSYYAHADPFVPQIDDAPPAPFVLPKDLAGAKPRYGYGEKKFTVEFEDDLDKALYILAQKTPSKHDARYMDAVLRQTGMTEAEARAAGAAVRDRIKGMAKDAPAGHLVVPFDEGIAHGSTKKTGRASNANREPKASIEQQMAALDAKPKFRTGADKGAMAEVTRKIPGVNPADVDEIMALGRQLGFNTPEFKAAVAARAQNRPSKAPDAPAGGSPGEFDPMEPGAPGEAGAPSRPFRQPDYAGKEFTFGGTGNAGPVRRVLGAIPQTEVSYLHSKGLNKTADLMDQIGNANSLGGKEVSVLEAEMKALNWKEEDLKQVHALMERGEAPQGTEKQQARIRKMADLLRAEFDRTQRTSTERDPVGAAPWIENYYPRTGAREGAPPPVHGSDNLQRPLDTVGQSKAASLTKDRVINPGDMDAEAFSRPITDPEELLATLRRRSRNAAALEAGATMERTPENYPRTWSLILNDAMDKATKGLGENEDGTPKKLSEGAALKVRERAKEKFESQQLPDLFEAVAKDRPNASWDDIIQNEDVVKASRAVIRGIDAMDPAARTVSNKAQELASAVQLALAAPYNAIGLQNTYPLAKDALLNKGHGELVASTIAAWKTLKAGLLSGKSLATDVSYAAARAVGAAGLSPSQKEFGPSGTRWNLARRAVVVTDRAARTGVADALEDLIPYMRPETLKFIDRSLPLTDPKNIGLARQEISALSQGSGNAANRLKPTGNAGVDLARELAFQYTGPSARLFEKAAPRAAGAIVGTTAAAVLYGELANDLRGVMRGQGANFAGPETTDQEEGRTAKSYNPNHKMDSVKATAKMIVSGDRSPHLGVRILQDLVPSIPGALAILSNAAYGKSGTLGQKLQMSIPAVGALDQITNAASLAAKTGDKRALLALMNGPFLGNEWMKVVALEAARRESAKKGKAPGTTGIGHVPQNSGWAFKIDEMMKGRITFEQALEDLIVNTQPGIEKQANQYRAKENAAAAKRK